MSTNSTDRPSAAKGVFILLAFIIVLIAVIATACGGPGNGKREATDSCEQAIKAKLWSPGTADFGTLGLAGNGSFNETGDGWMILGDLTASTALGGTATLSYRCDVVVKDGRVISTVATVL